MEEEYSNPQIVESTESSLTVSIDFTSDGYTETVYEYWLKHPGEKSWYLVSEVDRTFKMFTRVSLQRLVILYQALADHLDSLPSDSLDTR